MRSMRRSLLLLCLFWFNHYYGVEGADIADLFAFTAPVYNISLEENARGSQFAVCDDSTRMGISLPHPDSVIRYKIVKGDDQHQFKAHARHVGDFVFLRIKQKEKHDTPLNRELKDFYQFIVKASCKRKDSGNLETTTIVRLRVTDRNDASPMFTLDEDKYDVTVADNLAPFSNVFQVEASDADIGINGQIYYSLVNKSAEFYMDPVTGWIRTYKSLRAGVYEVTARAEDRTSRIFYDDEDQKQPDWTISVVITVTETKKVHPKLLVEKRQIDAFKTDREQIAAIIRIEGGDRKSSVVNLVDDDLRHWFHLNSSEDVWHLYTNKNIQIPKGTNVTVHAKSEFNTTATIIIDFIENHGLNFDSTKNVFSVDENAALGVVVGYFEAFTLSHQDTSLIRYSIQAPEAPNGSVPFKIGEKSGILRVGRYLDYELQKLYKFNVVAKLEEYEKVTETSVEVNIVDSNDHSPVFAAKWTRQGPISVSPSTAVGTSIIKIDAIDQDSNENSRIGYKLVSDKPLPFDVDHDTGNIYLSSPLPKQEREWPCTLWAVDWGRPWPRSSSVSLIFYRNGTKIPAKPRNVINQEPPNRHAPAFDELPEQIELPETLQTGVVVGKVKASDKDFGYNGLIQYSTWDDYFSINKTSGVITLTKSLVGLLKTGDSSTTHTLTVTATDSGTPRKSTSTDITVTIIDVNDHAPQFDQPWYRIHVSEDLAVGTSILMVSASDEDSGEYARVGYRLVHPSDDRYIDIDEASGQITLIKPLDRETEETLRYTIVAFDHGEPPMLSFVNLTIDIDDVNDNAPTCMEQYMKVTVPEDYPHGALIACLSAYDRDAAANARLRYNLENKPEHPPFRVDHHTGCVFINSPSKPLDYELKSFYNLTIDVSDNGESILSTNCYLEVQLNRVEENLHSPEFDDVAYEASVYENMPSGTEVFTLVPIVTNHKKDLYLDYSFVGGDGIGFFSIDNGTIRTLVMLDREENSKFWLAIQVSDSSASPRSTVVHVFVKVLDKNDHRPFPGQPIYFASVMENSMQNVVVVKLEASDADEVDGKPQSLHYAIVKGDPQSFFRIDEHTGYISTSGSRKLDREKQAEHELTVSICDNGEPQLCSQVPVVITIDDANDNVPAFVQSIHHFNVQAGCTGQLCRVFAADPDTGVNGEIYYNITDGDSRFSINEFGAIHTSEPLGNDEVFPLTIQSTDKGLPAQLSQTRVVLTGVASSVHKPSNKPPVVKKIPADIHISDADQVGFAIAMMEAIDPDDDSTWWRIVDGNLNETFSIQPDSGALVLAKPIDQLPKNVSEITLLMKVSDGKLESDAKVVIKISRSPSRRPQFSAQHYRTEISEKTAVGSQIYTIKATSDDVTTSKPILYGIHSIDDISMADKFRVEPNTGNVVLMEPLDFEATRQAKLIVSARQGTLTNYAVLIIGITNANDNPPQFLQKEYEGRIALSSEVGSVVLTVAAHDADARHVHQMKYSIVSGNELHFFKLEEQTGIIRVDKTLSADHVESILTIRVTDGGKYPLTDTCVVRIKVTVDEEKIIRFERPIYQTSTFTNTPAGSILLVVSTIPNGQSHFFLKKPCPYFTVHPISGAVSLRRWLSHERSKFVQCTIGARGKYGNETFAKIILKLRNSNQYHPIFQQQVYYGSIRENSPAESPVLSVDNTPLTVSATDKDSGPSGLVGYRTVNPHEKYFVVDFVSGAIRARKPIDYEKVQEISFYVQASDMGQPSLTTAVPTLVIVKIIDENDEKPVFSSKSYTTNLFLPTISNIPVIQLEAHDLDTIGKLRFFINNPQPHFSVNKTSGLISTSTSNFTSTSSPISLNVLVSDGLFSDSTTVTINLINTMTSSGFRCSRDVFHVKVKENEDYPAGKNLVMMSVVQPPDNVPLTYHLLNDHLDDKFMLNERTGMISLTGRPFDRELEGRIQLLVQIRAAGSDLRTQCTVNVEVEDVNDSTPMFLSLPYAAVVSMEAKKGDRVMAVRAVDKDYGANAMVQYFSNDLPKEFKLNKHDGRITVVAALSESREYEFEVTASDQGSPSLSSTVPVKISVVDKDQPIFSDSRIEVNLTKTAKKGDKITKLKAISNVGSRLFYSIQHGNEEALFTVDSGTGDLLLASDLKSFSRPSYHLEVMVTDVLRTGVNASAVVDINIPSDTSSTRAFKQTIYHVNVTESMSPGAELIQLGNDDDEHVFTYAVAKDVTAIRIDSLSGTVYLAEPLDYEKKREHVIDIQANLDSSSTPSSAKLLLHVLDVNDNVPTFTQPFTSAQVSDSAVEGQFIAIMSVVDEDTVASLPDGQRLVYAVIDGDESLFTIDKHTGEVTLRRLIEDEDLVNRKKTLNISVSDGVFTSYGQLTMNVVVSGLRHAAPRFEQSQYVLRLRENTGTENKSVLLTVKVYEGVAPIKFSLGGGRDSKSWPVYIDRNLGKIHQRKSLTHSNSSLFIIPLIAEDSIGRRAFSTLTLNVIDENDQPPVFVAKRYSCSISPLFKEGEHVLLTSATDEDEGDSIEYSLLSDDDEYASFWNVHPRTGIVSLSKKLDGKVGTTMQFSVKATDMANPPHHDTTDVSIVILSPETPIPRFGSNHYVFNVDENAIVGTVIGRLQQIENTVEAVRFTIPEPPNDLPFMIEKNSGKLIVRGVLDRELVEQWKFIVRAEAPGGAHTVTTVTIRLNDIDDNAPVFHGNYAKQSISEDAPVGTSIAVFSATDADDISGGRIHFSINDVPGAEMVEMDTESGWLLVAKQLDREMKSFYDLTARATDDAGNFNEVPFRLEVIDVNDEAPIFDKKVYTANLDVSKANVGDLVAKISVSDADNSPFNQTRLFISKGNEDGLFAIDSNGKVTVDRTTFPLNHNVYNLTVLAFDGKFSTTAQLQITVKLPVLPICVPDDLLISLKENKPIGSLVWNNTDRTDYSYQILSTVPFRVHPSTGVIYSTALLDRENVSKYEFDLRAFSTTPVAECLRHVVVTVEDDNDNSPVFDKTLYDVTVKENQKATKEQRYFVVDVHAEDKDSGPNGQIKYSLVDGFNAFVIDDKTGVVTLTKALDRESKDFYELHVIASDSGDKPRSAKAIIKIHVADQNDNAPQFSQKEWNLQVLESESIGYTLATVEADGGDTDEIVTYSLEKGKFNSFVVIDSKTGVLKLNKPLDFEKEKNLALTVVATDSGSPPLSSKALINVQILDENDNVPKFANDQLKATVKENSDKGTKVIKVEARDDDSEHYGKVKYSIVGDAGPFSIREDGTIVVNGSIDYETTQSYDLKIEAKDGGGLSSTTNVSITVEDVNDHAPQFAVCNMTAVVQEGVPVNHVVYTLSVKDLDGKGFGEPFKIELKGDGHRHFRIVDATDIVTASPLKHSQWDKFLLTVYATDKGGLTSDCPLTIFVKEESRHPPQLAPLSIKLNTLKGEFKGGVIGKLIGIDEDKADMLRYSIVEGTIRGPLPPGSHKPTARIVHDFKVNEETGEVWAGHSIAPGKHKFDVVVTDGKYPTLSQVQVEVVVLTTDILEHAVAVRVLNVALEKFLAAKMNVFLKVFAKCLNVLPEQINILSMQDAYRDAARPKRATSMSGVDILFSVERGSDRGMLKPDHVYSRLKQDFHDMVLTSGMEYQITTEICIPGVCQRGECRERIELSDQDTTFVTLENVAFVSPVHHRNAECSCPEGFSGSDCSLRLNQCARSPCKSYQMCAPDGLDSNSFECICPPGMTGERCHKPDCDKEGRCSEEAELSVDGTGFFEMFLANDVEERIELELEFRTITQNGTVFFGKGSQDFHSLDVFNGRLQYSWDAGSGPGLVSSNTQISDGKWHHVLISRRGKRTRLHVDHQEKQEAYSPVGSDVVNLKSTALVLVIGARVDRHGSEISLSRGISACFKKIAIDGRTLPKTRQGLRLFGATTSCKAMASTPCTDYACKNGATCVAHGKVASCLCTSRYDGQYCEIDKEPCADDPCPTSIQCIPFYNDYLCKCPDGFTGKQCTGPRIKAPLEDACISEPCGPNGECIAIPRQNVNTAGFICNCTHGLTSEPCEESRFSLLSKFSITELLVIVFVAISVILVCVAIICICKCIRTRSAKEDKYGEHVAYPHLQNPQLSQHNTISQQQPAPPLPPRTFRNNNKLSNLEQAQLTGLPTVQVRPFPVNERVSSSGRGDSRSPSISGNWKSTLDYSDEMLLSRSSDAKQLEALRRFGVKLSDDDNSSVGSSKFNRSKRGDRREKAGRSADALEVLNKDRQPLGDSIQCLPTASQWNDGPSSGDRVGEAVKDRLRLDNLNGRMQVGETVLSPLVNDEDYMTMRPRKNNDSAESQRRPLLADHDDDVDSEAPPLPPAHKKLYTENCPTYDDPAYDLSSRTQNSKHSMFDIDASDAEDIPINI